MSAEQKNIIIDIGSDFILPIICKNDDGSIQDLGDCTFYARLRETYDSPIALADFTCSVSSPSTKGEVIISLEKSITDTLKRTHLNNYVWDCKMINSLNKVIPKYFGNVMVRGNASAEDES